MNKKKYIGIDIGGTAVKIGSVDEDGTIHATETYAVNFDGYETPILQTVVKSCHNFLEKYRENASEYAGIGVSATGAISTKKGVVEGTAGHIKNWINSPIRQVMEQEFHIPTEVLNDDSACSFSGNCTSETGISGLISASRCCSFPHPATPVIIANASPSARHFLIFLFHISVPVLSA